VDLALRVLATVIGGAVLSLLCPPPNWQALAWVAYLPMLLALDPARPRLNAWLGWLYGVVGVGLLFRWIVGTITLFSPIPAVGAVAILLLFAAVFGSPYVLLWVSVHPLRRRLGSGWVLAWPALQVLIEWVSMHVLLFPYNHGVGQYRVPYTWQLTSVTGVWGLTFLLFFVNAVLAEALFRRREGGRFPVRALSGAVVTVALVVIYGAWRYERVEAVLREAPKLRIAQLQSDHGMDYRMSHSAREAWDEWVGMTKAIPPGAVDVVVWPEGASPYDLNEDGSRPNQAAKVLSDLARSGNFDLVVGGGTRVRTPDPEMGEDRVEVFNSVYWFAADGALVGHYDKLVPLPFGEYLPLGWLFPDSLGRSLGIGDFRAGRVPVVFEGTNVKAATPICYEAVLPATCRLFADADLFITVTNDAWFGDTANPWQHEMMAATRATELGIPMYRSAYTGVSAAIEPHGVIHAETRPFARVSRVVEVRVATFPTLYKRFGDWFVWLCGLGFAGSLWATRQR
jgi:apolipoprotein N-acyltransferase